MKTRYVTLLAAALLAFAAGPAAAAEEAAAGAAIGGSSTPVAASGGDRAAAIAASANGKPVPPPSQAQQAPAPQPEAASGGGSDDAMIQSAMFQSDIGYYTLTPDFTTNAATSNPRERLHYVRVRICLMLTNKSDEEIVVGMDPVIKDMFLNILGGKTFSEIASTEGREKIRTECREKLVDMLQEKIGRTIVQDVLFLSYMFQ